MAKAIFSVDRNKIHTVSQFNYRYNHNYRIKGCDNADPEKAKLNEELIRLEHDTYTQAFNARLKELEHYKDHKVRKNAVRGVEVMLTYGSRRVPEGFDFEKWKSENITFLKETFGEKNVVSAVLHMDETVPHIHAIIIPEVRGRLNAKEMFDAKHLEKYQEDYAERMNRECGLEKRTKYSRARHEDIKKFYSAINDAVLERLPEPKKDENISDYFERAQEVYIKKNLQNLAKIKEMNQAITEAKNDAMESSMKNATLLSQLEEMRGLMGENMEEMRRKIKLINFINYGLKNYPDEDYVKAAKRTIGTLVSFAKEHEEEIRQL